MPQQKQKGVSELSVELRGGRAELIKWLHDRGIDDYVEASCNFLDASRAEAEDLVAAYERGEVDLPLLIYSYDHEWVQELRLALRQTFAERIQVSERHLPNELWQEAWELDFRWLETRCFKIVPEDFADLPENNDKKLIRLASGSVFGSGQHATTQALVRLLEDMDETQLGHGRLLDVGTGTGVLAFVAHHLGFRSIVATDIEAEALAVAAKNQNLNQVYFELREGSVPNSAEPFDVLVCNILPPTLTSLLPELVAALRDGGYLYLAGLNEANESPVLESLRALGMHPRAERSERGWWARSWQK